jgi:hypothetical protein
VRIYNSLTRGWMLFEMIRIVTDIGRWIGYYKYIEKKKKCFNNIQCLHQYFSLLYFLRLIFINIL